MRLFTAVDLTSEARRAIEGALQDLRRDLRGAGLEDAFRWVAVDNLHLTLRFLGTLDEDAAARVIAAMDGPLEQPRGAIVLGRPGTFPPRGRPRVLHVAVSAGAGLLRALRDELDVRLAPVCAWEPETRPFAPHLTLARARDAATFNPDDGSRLIASAAWPPIAVDVPHVTLFSSRTLPAGPEYTARARAALRSS